MGGGSTIEVRVPRMSRVKMKSFNARITAENLGGSLKAESFEGSLSVTRGPAEIVLKSTSGSVEVQANATRVEVESVNGSIQVRDVSGQLKARSVNGSISVEGRRFDEVKLSTVSGRVRFEGDIGPKASARGQERERIGRAAPAVQHQREVRARVGQRSAGDRLRPGTRRGATRRRIPASAN